jgi:3-phosphoshikimate 1-carboxyvinyltransferase
MELGEPMCDLIVRGTAKRAPFKIQGELVPRLIDEIPVLALLATQCDGVSEIRDAQELVVKESNRLLVMAEGLRKMGADVELLEDGLIISGPTPLRAASIDSCHDHRIAMTFAIAGLIADGETEITGEDQIRTSYPEFESHMSKLCR